MGVVLINHAALRSSCVRKLLKQISEAGSGNGGIRYFTIFETKNNKLKFIYTAEGRAVPMNDTIFEYQYFLKDHLGNTRVVLSQSGQVLQKSAYYPFGMLMGGFNTVNNSGSDNRYLYNGKELQTDFGLDWYDYGARFYDASLGRWSVPDPLAEKYYSLSSYNYTLNNPICFIDPDGMWADDPPKVGSTQIYITISGSFGPQLGINIGKTGGLLRFKNIVGETKIGLNFSPNGKITPIFEQSSKVVDHSAEGSINGIYGGSTSKESKTNEDPSMAKTVKTSQKGLVKETKSENYEESQKQESVSYEQGIGVHPVLLGIELKVGFESVQSSETVKKDAQPKKEPPQKPKKEEQRELFLKK